jgi:hypothetical protein
LAVVVRCRVRRAGSGGLAQIGPAVRVEGFARRGQYVKLPAPTLVFGLERLRWARYDIIDGGGFNSHEKVFEASDTTAIVCYDGAVGMGYIEESEICQLTTLHFQRTGGTAMKPGEVDPIVVSEVLRDLDELATKAES